MHGGKKRTDALLAAKNMADRLTDGRKRPYDLSIHSAIALGLMMVNVGAQTMIPVGKKGEAETRVESLVFGPLDTHAIIEEYFYSIIIRSALTPDEVSSRFASTLEILVAPRNLSRLLTEALGALRRREGRGRPTKITRDNWPELVESASNLLPTCTALLRLQRTAKKRPISDHLEFLRLDHPNEIEYLTRHISKVEAVTSDSALLGHIKTARTRAKKLADIFAGFAFALKPLYAMQQASAARRRFPNLQRASEKLEEK